MIKNSRLFRFLSSVRLAVPLLLVLAAVVAIGTLLESHYSAAYAKLMIYDAGWFYALMALLGINILCAALSRLPWRRHHTGFVITHLGMLIMLTGAFVTSRWGIDGQLRVQEGQNESRVELPGLELSVSLNDRMVSRLPVPRYVRPKSAGQLKWLGEKVGHGITFKSYQPFTMPAEEFVAAEGDANAAPAISFWLRSQFFNTSEWLHARERADIELGPARLRMILDNKTAARSLTATPELRVYSHPEGKLIRKTPLKTLTNRSSMIGSSRIQVVNVLEQASVVGNRLIERGGTGVNPALELQVSTPKGVFREVAYAHFPDFSLIKDPEFPFRFEYVLGALVRPDTNLIEFHVATDGSVRVELYKRGQLVLAEPVKEGSLVETPWMGMKIVVARYLPHGVRKSMIRSLAEPPKGAMPPSAFEVVVAGESLWVSEGDTLEFPSPEGTVKLSYGYKSLNLPFSVHLDRFVKEDYPGTDKALSFESHVRIPEANEASVISMNNPLVRAGFTLYQSSFQVLPDRPPLSILSVNQDPGRALKYLGGIVMSLGIVIYVLMRSRLRQVPRASK